jgi:hypothetical protein
VLPGVRWSTCRHMQSLGELQQLNNWSVNAELRGSLAQRHTRHSAGSLLLLGVRRERRRFPVGARPTRQALQPDATGAVMEETKWLKPSVRVSRIGEHECVLPNATAPHLDSTDSVEKALFG